MQYMTADMAVLIAGLVGFTLSSLLTPAALDAWGWRLAFIAGAAVVPVGLGMRRSLPETMTAAAEIPASRPTPGPPVRLIVLGLLMLGGSTIASYVINYTTTYAQDSLHLTANVAFGATIVSGVSFVVADLFSGLLSDRIGRKPVMLASSVLTLASTIAAYAAMTSSRSVLVLFASTAWLSALQSFLSAPVLIAVAESLPKSMRSAGLATLYAVAISIFGGTTQVVIKLLIDKTGSPLAPAWYMTAALAVGAIAMALFPESAPAKTGPPTAPRPIQ
jgi:MFS family permease